MHPANNQDGEVVGKNDKGSRNRGRLLMRQLLEGVDSSRECPAILFQDHTWLAYHPSYWVGQWRLFRNLL